MKYLEREVNVIKIEKINIIHHAVTAASITKSKKREQVEAKGEGTKKKSSFSQVLSIY